MTNTVVWKILCQAGEHGTEMQSAAAAAKSSYHLSQFISLTLSEVLTPQAYYPYLAHQSSSSLISLTDLTNLMVTHQPRRLH